MKSKRNSLWVMLVITMIASLITSCTPAPTAAPTAAPTQAATQPTVAPTAAPTKASAGGDKSLVIYTNSGSDGRDQWLKDRAAKEGWQLEIVVLGAAELTNRVLAEKNNQIADLVYGLNAIEYEKLKTQKMLLKYEPTWAKEVDMAYGDKNGYYYPIVVQPLVLVYNPKMLSKDKAPKDWPDLVKPEFKDKYVILPLSGGTGKTILASIAARYPDPKGTYGVSDKGWEVVKGYIQNSHIAATGEDYWATAISGTRPMFMMWGSGLLQNEKDRNVDFDFMVPEIGVPFVVEQVAVFANSKKTALAVEFANWFGSAAIQTEWSAKFGTTPAHPEALKKASDQVKALMAAVKPQQMDWAFIAANVDKWVEKCELEYVK